MENEKHKARRRLEAKRRTHELAYQSAYDVEEGRMGGLAHSRDYAYGDRQEGVQEEYYEEDEFVVPSDEEEAEANAERRRERRAHEQLRSGEESEDSELGRKRLLALKAHATGRISDSDDDDEEVSTTSAPVAKRLQLGEDEEDAQ
jgi:hypothetical protein